MSMRRAISPAIWMSTIIFVAIIALLDYLLITYLMSYGLEARTQPLQLGGFQLSVPLLGLMFMGLLILAVAAWGNIATTAPATAFKDTSGLDAVRMLRAAALAILVFSAALFLPYVVGTGMFWGAMASLGRSVPQLVGSIGGFFSSVQSLMTLDAMAKLAISQSVAAAALVAASGLISRSQSRVRRIR